MMDFIFWSYLRRAAARLSAFGPSKFVVGSSRASIPQWRQNVSAKANRIISEARTYEWTISSQFPRCKNWREIAVKYYSPSDQHYTFLSFQAQRHLSAWQPALNAMEEWYAVIGQKKMNCEKQAQFLELFLHFYLVAVRTSPSTFRIWMYANIIYILSSVCLLPQFSNDFINFLHFHCVEAHECPNNTVTVNSSR